MLLTSACGKKGPPLPPLVRIPAAPADITVARRGQAVDVQFVLPSANTDGSKPANVQRVEVYALNGAAPAADVDVMRTGTRVGAVDVKAPRDPNQTIEEDEPDSDIETLDGPGLDQGAVAHVRELLTAAMLNAGDGTRTYVAVGITTRGRRAMMSKTVAVPLTVAPAAPPRPDFTYTETAITVTWPAVDGAAGELAYHLYDVSPPPPPSPATPPSGAAARPAASAPVELRLTDTPQTARQFVDNRVAWAVERCYTVRAVQIVSGLAVEGDAAPPKCAELKDTFPPAAPTGVTAVASEGAINLIWTPGTESDLAGYRVLRAALPDGVLAPVTADVIKESTFTDSVQAGLRYAYVVQAVDSAGNVSASSARVEETAR